MRNVSLTDFRATQEAAERQKRLAAALREQSTTPIQIQSYNGIQAPIPWTEVLAKALAGYAANRKETKADEALAEGRAKARTETAEFLRKLKQETPQDRFITPPNFQPEQPGFIDRLKAAGQSFMPQQAPQQAPPPQPMVAPQAPPPMAPAQPMPQGPEAIPQMSDMRQIPAELQNRARSPEEQQQMLMDAMMSGNPYLEKLAPSMYEDIESQQTAAAKRERQLQAIIGLDIPDDRKRMLIAGLDLGDNPFSKQAFPTEAPLQAPSGVIARIMEKAVSGTPLNAEETRIYNLELRRMKREGEFAPRASGGSGGGGGRSVRTEVGNDGKTYYTTDGANWYSTRAEAMAGG
jgi:hypothetical protein